MSIIDFLRANQTAVFTVVPCNLRTDPESFDICEDVCYFTSFFLLLLPGSSSPACQVPLGAGADQPHDQRPRTQVQDHQAPHQGE